MGKLIDFPITNKRSTEPDPIEIDMNDFKISQISDMADWVAENVKMIMFQMGHNEESRFNEKDMMMMYETVASILCRYHNIEHPMHELVEDMITFDEEGDLIEDEPAKKSENVKLNDTDRL